MEQKDNKTTDWQTALRFCLSHRLITKQEVDNAKTPQQKQELAARAIIRMKKYQEAHKE